MGWRSCWSLITTSLYLCSAASITLTVRPDPQGRDLRNVVEVDAGHDGTEAGGVVDGSYSNRWSCDFHGCREEQRGSGRAIEAPLRAAPKLGRDADPLPSSSFLSR